VKKVLLFIFIVLGSLLIMTYPAKADSGWDSDYDSGGSSWDSDWSSGSSWDNNYDWDDDSNSYSSSNSTSNDFYSLLLFIFIFGVVVISSIRRIKRSSTSVVSMPIYNDISPDIILVFGYTLDNLKKELFDKFVDIQNAWMEFDYNSMRNLCTNELYNAYKSQLEVLKIKNGKNIMNEFDLQDIKIVNMHEEGNQIVVDVFMKVSFFDYVIDTKTDKVTRGKKDQKITNSYMMTFIKGNNSDSSLLVKCPSCGAETHVNTTGTCEYCRSVIVKDANEFVLSKKKNIN